MSKSITGTEKFLTGNSLIALGYRDYIAARFLLNNEFVVQGLTLASTAIEKYLKSLIVFNAKEKEKYYFHFDNLEKLKNLASKNNPGLMEKFDPVFLKILEDAFKIRYYDKIEKPIFIGLYLNQFIGELDYTIDFMEKFIIQTQKGETSITPYKRAIENRDKHLHENNFVLSNHSKKDFMEKPSSAFSISIRIGGVVQSEEIVKGGSIANSYDGRISTFITFRPFSFI